MDAPARQPLALLNDEPVAEPGNDLLGGGRAARKLARLLVASRTSTPLTLAVDAGWGMGKSSLMRLVDAELQDQPDVYTVWYNAWTSTGPDALEGLIKSVLSRFGRKPLRRALRRASDGGFLLGAGRWLLLGLSLPFGVPHLVDEMWTRLSRNAQARNQMRERIDDLAQDWARNPDSPRLLVVFIDDLDRCSEETVLAVCEALKVYLDVPGLAFVVGGDRSALSPAGLLRDLTPAGAAFMEKVFQTSYRIPVANGGDVREYVRACARKARIDHLLDDELLALLAERSGRNPRRVKRLVNGFVLEATLNPVWQDFGPEAVIRALLLQYLYTDFYRMMTSPVDAMGGDVIAEFRGYQDARRFLRVADQLTDEQRSRLAEVLTDYGIGLPSDPARWGATLTELEQQLPSGFPELASDPVFTSLLEELLRLPDAEKLTRRLREGTPEAGREYPRPFEGVVPPQSVGAYEPQPPYAYGSVPSPDPEQSFTIPYEPPSWYGGEVPGYGGQAYGPGDAGAHHGRQLPSPGGAPQGAPPPGAPAREQQLAGKQILWVHDDPEGQDHEVRLLQAQGARVRLVGNAEELQAHVVRDSPDLLISDVTRSGDVDAGFSTLQALRDAGTYTGPAVFYTGRITPARQERAEALGASLTAEPGELVRQVREGVGLDATA